MTGSSPTHAVPARDGPPDRRSRRPRRAFGWTAAVLLLALAALAAAALIPGSHTTGDSQARRSVAGAAPAANPLRRETHVVDSRVSAARYGEQIARLENGVGADGLPISDLSPIAARRFDRPIAEYRAYAERWGVRLDRDAGVLAATLRSGHRARARAAWSTAFADYLHLGAVYGLLPVALDDRLAEVPGSPSDRHFPGLHRIERGLWTGAPLAGLVPVAIAVQHAAARLRRVLPHVVITPLDYATRAHEILEDAQRDLMSGAQVPWSGAGVLGTAAGLTATRKVVATLVPLLAGRENTLGETRYWLRRLGAVLQAVRRPDGSYPSLRQLSQAQRIRIDGTLAGTLGALSEVPGTLETHQPHRIPAIPNTGTGR